MRHVVFLCMAGGHADIVHDLLTAGASIRGADANGWSALHHAAFKGFATGEPDAVCLLWWSKQTIPTHVYAFFFNGQSATYCLMTQQTGKGMARLLTPMKTGSISQMPPTFQVG